MQTLSEGSSKANDAPDGTRQTELVVSWRERQPDDSTNRVTHVSTRDTASTTARPEAKYRSHEESDSRNDPGNDT